MGDFSRLVGFAHSIFHLCFNRKACARATHFQCPLSRGKANGWLTHAGSFAWFQGYAPMQPQNARTLR